VLSHAVKARFAVHRFELAEGDGSTADSVPYLTFMQIRSLSSVHKYRKFPLTSFDGQRENAGVNSQFIVMVSPARSARGLCQVGHAESESHPHPSIGYGQPTLKRRIEHGD